VSLDRTQLLIKGMLSKPQNIIHLEDNPRLTQLENSLVLFYLVADIQQLTCTLQKKLIASTFHRFTLL